MRYSILVLFRNVLHREADTSHLVLAKADNGNLVSKSKNILNTVDTLFCDLGNMNHSLFARCELDECTKFLDANNSSCKDLTFLEIGYNRSGS